MEQYTKLICLDFLRQEHTRLVEMKHAETQEPVFVARAIEEQINFLLQAIAEKIAEINSND